MNNFTPEMINNRMLIEAARKCDLYGVARYLDRGADINAVTPDGTTALIIATRHNHQLMSELLIKRGANINAVDQFGETALIWEVKHKNTTAVQLLLERGANVIIDVATDEGKTALILAAENCHKAMVDLLLNYGANIDTVDELGNSALITAVEKMARRMRNGYQDIVELLIYRGANIDVINQSGNTAISYVVEGFFSPMHQNNNKLKDDYRKTFKILAEHNAVINEKTQAILDEKDERDELKQYTGCVQHYLFK